jgi:hypothetical protein
MIQTLKKYSGYIKDYSIVKYQSVGSSYGIVLRITFNDLSELHVTDYLFLDGKRKYVFHYQKKNAELIFRYDSAPHWKDLKTFPYHKHLQDKTVVESNIMYLDSVLHEIVDRFH